jgi:hypothetical protein
MIANILIFISNINYVCSVAGGVIDSNSVVILRFQLIQVQVITSSIAGF